MRCDHRNPGCDRLRVGTINALRRRVARIGEEEWPGVCQATANVVMIVTAMEGPLSREASAGHQRVGMKMSVGEDPALPPACRLVF